MSELSHLKSRLQESVEAVARLESYIAGQPPNAADEWMVYAVIKQHRHISDDFAAEVMRVIGPFIEQSRKNDAQPKGIKP